VYVAGNKLLTSAVCWQSFREGQIAELYDEVYRSLHASLRRQGLSAEDIEDIIQEAFLRLLCCAPDGLPDDAMRYWLFRVAHNLAVDTQRAGWKYTMDPDTTFDAMMAVSPGDDFNPEQQVLHAEKWQSVENALTTLTPRQQHAIHLRIAGMSHKDIALHLKSNTQSVAELIRRGLERLRETLGRRPNVLAS
jgi:RNA polymerase sigma factor (sigma-70 family)